MVFPFMVEVGGARIVIVGGGAVAFRKFELFRSSGAAVRIVSPALSPLFSGREGEFEYLPGPFCPGCLEGALAAVAASDDPRVNRWVARCCRERGIWVNTADDPEECTFFVPATLRQGDLTIGISTGGKSPALAGRIRDRLAGQFGPEYARRLELLGQVRELLKDRQPQRAHRRQLLVQAAEMESGELEGLLERLEREYAATSSTQLQMDTAGGHSSSSPAGDPETPT